jgi:hypothetical protein
MENSEEMQESVERLRQYIQSSLVDNHQPGLAHRIQKANSQVLQEILFKSPEEVAFILNKNGL